MTDVTVIFGRRGCGKSTLARKVLADRRRVIVFDPQWEHDGEVVTSVSELAEAMLVDWTGYRIAYRPEGDRPLKTQLHDLADAVWRVQADFQAGRSRLECTLAVDEANLSYPATQLPEDQRAMDRLVLQGRHRGVSLLAISQRPALVSSNIRGNADVWYVFALANHADRQAVAEQFGREYLPRIRGLKPYTYIGFRDGELIA